MILSENAARGEKTVATTSAICTVVALLPILTFNIISAVLGFGAARYLKKGSIAAKNLCIMLRVADLPLLATVLIVFYNFAGETAFKLCFVSAALVAAFDMIIIMSLTSADAKAYFQEVYDWQQTEQIRRSGQVEQPRQPEIPKQPEASGKSELLRLAEQSGTPKLTEQTEFSEPTEQAELPEQTEQIEQPENSDTAVISDK